MDSSSRLQRLIGLWASAILTAALSISPAKTFAAEQNDPQQKPGAGQKVFASPEEAVNALRTATQAHDKTALHEIFGPEFDQLLTGDATQDAKNAEKFAAAVAQSCKPVPDGQDMVTLEVGTNDWPMPIPLVKSDGQWHFDTPAGREEIITRHVGRDELHAIGVCRAYVKAQQQHAGVNPGQNGAYALKFKSAPGERDGLYWPSAENEPASPFGPSVAEAQSDAEVNNTDARTRPQPFHGYFFRVLTRQGPAAPGGKKDYMSQGALSGGFALVAYPAHWDQSGIMTFIVNQDGKVYERNLGEKTVRAALKMKSYNPDGNWKPVEEEGIASSVSEKVTP
jgi:hypothetical protein